MKLDSTSRAYHSRLMHQRYFEIPSSIDISGGQFNLGSGKGSIPEHGKRGREFASGMYPGLATKE